VAWEEKEATYKQMLAELEAARDSIIDEDRHNELERGIKEFLAEKEEREREAARELDMSESLSISAAGIESVDLEQQEDYLELYRSQKYALDGSKKPVPEKPELLVGKDSMQRYRLVKVSKKPLIEEKVKKEEMVTDPMTRYRMVKVSRKPLIEEKVKKEEVVTDPMTRYRMVKVSRKPLIEEKVELVAEKPHAYFEGL